MNRFDKLAEERDVDVRVLNSFIQGYRKNEHGQALNETEEAKKKSDEKFLNDYLSKDIELRRPHLEVMKEEILNYEFDFDMVKSENFSDNCDYLINMSEKLMYFENVLKDPINEEYFDSIPIKEKKLLEIQLKKYASYGLYITHLVKSKGVDTTSTGVAYMSNYECDNTAELEMLREMLPDKETMLRDALIKGRKEKNELNILIEQSEHYIEEQKQLEQKQLEQKISENETTVKEKRAQRFRHLNFLHKWKKEDREKIKERFTKENQKLQPIQATAVADGIPIQTIKPPKKSFRQWIENKRRSIVAKWHIWAGDHISYNLNEKLSAYEKKK